MSSTLGLPGKRADVEATSVICFQSWPVGEEPGFHELHHEEDAVIDANLSGYAINQLG